MSGDDHPNRKMQNMIGKDISEIVDGKNLRLSEGEENY